jgi:RHS repeat-associated protein
MVSAGVAGGTEYYQYTADNKRVVTYAANGTATVVTYGAFGEKLSTGGVYNNVYFAGRLIARDALAGQPMDSYFAAVDRLGSVRTTASYLPYGEEITATANGTVKFATYTRDASTGLDYADQRYYASTFGRFMSADRFKQAAKANDSGSWNKYSYTRGDPVNRIDPHGTEDWCDDNPEDCEPPCVGQAFLGSCGEAGSVGGPGPGGGGPPPPQPKCYQDEPRVKQTLSDVGANILAIFAADFQSTSANSLSFDLGIIGSFIQQAMNDETTARQTNPLANYTGGHFNLDLNVTALEPALGADGAEFQADFNGNGDGTRQKAIVGSSSNVLSYYLHSKNDQSVSGQIDFHLDRWSGTNFTGPLHWGYDVAYGTFGGHPCLDPAWH